MEEKKSLKVAVTGSYLDWTRKDVLEELIDRAVNPQKVREEHYDITIVTRGNEDIPLDVLIVEFVHKRGYRLELHPVKPEKGWARKNAEEIISSADVLIDFINPIKSLRDWYTEYARVQKKPYNTTFQDFLLNPRAYEGWNTENVASKL